jgi:hypothetical protein
MTPELYQRIQALMQAALELESDQRASFLNEACGGEAAVRQQVEALIISHAQASSFLESPAVEFAGLFDVSTNCSGIQPPTSGSAIPEPGTPGRTSEITRWLNRLTTK